MSDVTRILSQIESGDPAAAEQLLPLVYEELRKLATAKLSREKPGQTLNATALVHEAYIRLVGDGQRSEIRGQKSAEPKSISDLRPPTSDLWDSRGHFFAAAAEAMRRILLMNARRRQAEKHGGGYQRIELDSDLLPGAGREERLLVLDEALEAFEQQHPDKARLVKLRFFAGLTNAQAAAALGVSDTTADRHWAYARAWLQREMNRDESSPPPVQTGPHEF